MARRGRRRRSLSTARAGSSTITRANSPRTNWPRGSRRCSPADSCSACRARRTRARGACARERASPDAERARAGARLPELQDDARPLDGADRREHACVHPPPDRCRRHEERDQAPPRRRLRSGRAGDAAAERLRPARVARTARWRARGRGGGRRRGLALEPRAAPTRTGRGSELERPRTARARARAATRGGARPLRRLMLTSVPIAFFAGLLSVVSPCVLPLVPGYLSIVSAGEAQRLGEPGVGRRVAVATVPFFAGFTVVFVLLGATAAFVAEQIGTRGSAWIAGFVLVVFGLGFMGLLPLPQRVVAPGLVGRARSSVRRSQCVRRRASVPFSPASWCWPGTPGRSRADRRCSRSTPPASRSRSSWPASASRASWPASGGSVTTTTRFVSPAEPSSSRSGCCCSSTATGGCSSPSTARSTRSASVVSDAALEARRGQHERAGGDRSAGGVDLRQERREREPAVMRGVRRQAPRGLVQLSSAARRVGARRLVPGDGDMEEPLVEVALARRRGAPRQLELLVGREVLSGRDQL